MRNLSSQPTYYYISFFVNEHDSVFGASIIESGSKLTTIPNGYSQTTKEDIHNFGYLTPSESRAQAQFIAPALDQLYGSYISVGYGHPPAEPKDGPVHIPEFKYATCGSFTEALNQGEYTLYVSDTPKIRDKSRCLH